MTVNRRDNNMRDQHEIERQLTKLTGNAAAAKKLATQYFGMPKNVKTLIEAEGTNPLSSGLRGWSATNLGGD